MNRNSKYLPLIQTALIISIFVTIIGVYCFNTNQVMATQSLMRIQNDTLVTRITALELVVTNHCSATTVRLTNIESNMLDLKSDIADLSMQIRELR